VRYSQIINGQWFEPRMKNHYMKCCGCGLVHRLNFRVIKGKVQIQSFRIAVPAWAQIMRTMGYVVKRRKKHERRMPM
jgi:hypothetical protein